MAKKHRVALDLEFYCRDLDKKLTIRKYFHELLTALWQEGEGFSGKRPFGNSGWQTDLEIPLIKAGFIAGEIFYDEDDTDEEYPDVCVESQLELDGFIQGMIKELCSAGPAATTASS